MKTTVINLFASPGVGKSTLAAQIYAELKRTDKSVELVREVIKSWAYRGVMPSVFEQQYIVNEQMKEESSLYGKVEYLISDSPILLGSFYCEYYNNNELLSNLDYYAHNVWGKKDIKNVVNFFLKRDTSIKFQEEGRYSTVDESDFISNKLENYLKNSKIRYTTLNCKADERINLVKEYLINNYKGNNEQHNYN